MTFAGHINHQDYLLTVNTADRGEVENVLPGVHVTPLFIDPENSTWVLLLRLDAGASMPKHFHTGTVHVYTLSGEWNYSEYPDAPQTEGSYLYEPGGSIHTAQSRTGSTAFMIVQGANINFDDEGNFLNILDAGSVEAMIHHVVQATGQKLPRYIRPAGIADFTRT